MNIENRITGKLLKTLSCVCIIYALALSAYMCWLNSTQAKAVGTTKGVESCSWKFYEKFQSRNCLKYKVEFRYDGITYTSYVDDKYEKLAPREGVEVYFSKKRPKVTASLRPASDFGQIQYYSILCAVFLGLYAIYKCIRLYKNS